MSPMTTLLTRQDSITPQDSSLTSQDSPKHRFYAILRVATAFPQPQGSKHLPPPRDSQLNQHGDNEQSESRIQTKRDNSAFSRLGPFHNIIHKDYEGPQA